MGSWPYFWPMAVIGIISFLAELVFLVWVLRGKQACAAASDSRWPAVLSVVVALILPTLVVVLVSGGRRMLIELALGLRRLPWELMPMRIESNQQWVLLMGSSLSIPSNLLAAFTVGFGVSQRAKYDHRALLSSLAPAAMLPFFTGVWCYLYRLRTIHYPGLTGSDARPRATILANALVAAKHGLDTGALVSGLALVAVSAMLVARIIRSKTDCPPVRTSPMRSILASMAMLAVAAMLWWLAEPLAAENRVPFPGHDRRYTARAVPMIPAGLSQTTLYDLSETRVALPFPLVSLEQDGLVVWSPIITISDNSVMINGFVVNQEELSEELVRARGNDRLLHGAESVRAPLVMAKPDLPARRLADVLGVVYQCSPPEVRLVTGLPETIQRPALGAISRIIYQTSTVGLVRPEDIDPRNQNRLITLGEHRRRYRDVLDRVLELGQAPSPPAILLD